MDIERMKDLAGVDSELLTEVVEIPENVSLEQLETMLDAAKKGLGLANKLKNVNDKKKHMSATLTNLNKIRGALQRMINSL